MNRRMLAGKARYLPDMYVVIGRFLVKNWVYAVLVSSYISNDNHKYGYQYGVDIENGLCFQYSCGCLDSFSKFNKRRTWLEADLTIFFFIALRSRGYQRRSSNKESATTLEDTTGTSNTVNKKDRYSLQF